MGWRVVEPQRLPRRLCIGWRGLLEWPRASVVGLRRAVAAPGAGPRRHARVDGSGTHGPRGSVGRRRSWNATGAYGGHASGGEGSWTATSASGTTAYHYTGYGTVAYSSSSVGTTTTAEPITEGTIHLPP